MHHPVAFRCKNCGHLHHADHAGENAVPHACVACGSGITHSPTVKKLSEEMCQPETTPERMRQIANELANASKHAEVKTWEKDNWEILSDFTPERLEELGLEPHHVSCHKPEKITTPMFQGQVVRTATELTSSVDNA